jgi:hypothetical protein
MGDRNEVLAQIIGSLYAEAITSKAIRQSAA